MLEKKRLETIMGVVLTLGTIISALIVLTGGVLFLMQYGHADAKTELLFTKSISSNPAAIIKALKDFSPLGIIELGLFCLVASQILRVGLLVIYYISIRDYYFFAICSFVLLIILSTFVYNFIGI